MSSRTKKLTLEEPRNFNSRNTHDWCRGKEGVEHRWDWKPCFRRHHESGLSWHEERFCSSCGKTTNERRVKTYDAGFLIRTYREKHGWSQADLARKAGVDQSWVSQVEQSGASLTQKTIAKFAAVLGVEFEFKFGDMAINIP